MFPPVFPFFAIKPKIVNQLINIKHCVTPVCLKTSNGLVIRRYFMYTKKILPVSRTILITKAFYFVNNNTMKEKPYFL